MTYIRTKDGIKSICGENHITNTVSYYNSRGILSSAKVDGSRIADTIDELTDEAVFFDKDNKPHYKSQEGNIWYLGAGLFTETLRFGIFTDKGLIYVAKMNEKGVFELL